MMAGHFGLAAGVKSAARTTPLWAMMLATAWLDVVFVPLLLTGVETLEPIPGSDGGYGQLIIHADYTHSLAGAIVLSVLFGLVAALPWGRQVGLVLGGVVFSHWVLDLAVHRMDMPFLPGNAGALPRVGFGLWQLPEVSAIVELALVVIGAVLYWRAARAVVREAGVTSPRRAQITAALIAVAGITLLAVDFAG